jgi:peptide chain release factor 1
MSLLSEGLAAVSWDKLEARYASLSEELLSPTLDSKKRSTLQKEFSHLSELLGLYKAIIQLEAELSGVIAQKAESTDVEYTALLEEEEVSLSRQMHEQGFELEKLLFPPDELDNRSIFLEIRAGTGGQEAALFAGDLARMYMLYAPKKQWRASIASESPTDLGGFRDIVLHIEGKNVFGYLKHEAGVHRVQRVPSTETAGRIHTSTATIAVFPEAEEVEFTINPNDLRIDVYRASGAGGQHVNTTDSAVRITHIPTGVVVACQDERSQHKNKAKALKELQSRLYSSHKEKQEAEMSAQRKEQVGSATRSEKARTYNYPQNRITDHNADITLNKLDIIMEGNLDDILEPLMKKDLEERRKRALSSTF